MHTKGALFHTSIPISVCHSGTKLNYTQQMEGVWHSEKDARSKWCAAAIAEDLSSNMIGLKTMLSLYYYQMESWTNYPNPQYSVLLIYTTSYQSKDCYKVGFCPALNMGLFSLDVLHFTWQAFQAHFNAWWIRYLWTSICHYICWWHLDSLYR